MFEQVPEGFDLNELHRLYFEAVAKALGINSWYFITSKEELDEYNDKIYKKAWDSFADVPIDEQENIEHGFLHFPTGTNRFEIWHWFDKKCSKGLNWLMYGKEKERD